MDECSERSLNKVEDKECQAGFLGEKAQEDIEHGGGRWVHKITGTKLGDADGHLEFTVVGYVSVYSTTS